MIEIVITSSILIIALLVLRVLFRNTIPRRLQYALWGLVLIKLLIPVRLPALPISIWNTGSETQQAIITSVEHSMTGTWMERRGTPSYIDQISTEQEATPGEGNAHPVLSKEEALLAKGERQWGLLDVLIWVWWTGMIGMAMILLYSNFRFWRMLRRHRTPYPIDGCNYPVYLCNCLASPCLFGLFRPAIYVTSATVTSPRWLHHVLIHEETHARHWDPLWSLLRCICLTVYWFHPLVWVAAVVSKNDCETACDEGTLKRLGEKDRLSYGQTLLALVQMRSVNPMMATNMLTTGKRQMKDRITRIAKKPKSMVAALLAVAMLTAFVSACTFTSIPSTSPNETRPLNGQELTYFNEIFFNGGQYNIHNQFLTSLYEKPEEIDLFQLFYNGDGNTVFAKMENGMDQVSLEKLLAEAEGFKGEPPCPAISLTTAQMDAVLLACTGLTLQETERVGLSNFSYLESNDIYFHFHGDTNYVGTVTFTAGEQKGDQISLYYYDTYFGEGWKCVTLQNDQKGSYYFCSNCIVNVPKIPPALPDWDPECIISLDGLTPYQPPAITIEHHSGDLAQQYGNYQLGESVICIYQSTDGNVYAAVVNDSASGSGTWEADCFLQLPNQADAYRTFFFHDLFGYQGIAIPYFHETYHSDVCDYYSIQQDGTLLLIARTIGSQPGQYDLDGNGISELVTERSIVFQKDGQLYEADLPLLLEEHWKELEEWSGAEWDAGGRYLKISGLMVVEGWGEARAEFLRYLYFDGQNLSLYRDERKMEDHVLEGITVPEDVKEKVKKQVESYYISVKSGSEGGLEDQNFDDWRISSISMIPVSYFLTTLDGPEIELYTFSCEFHTSTPEEITLAGGTWVDENGWYGGFFSEESPYLVFAIQNGERILLENLIPTDTEVGSPAFIDGLNRTLEQAGLLSGS